MKKHIYSLIMGFFLIAGQAYAQNYFVSPTGVGNGTTWGQAANGISFLNGTGTNHINNIPSGSIVHMKEGTYNKNGGGGSVAWGANNDNITIQGGYPGAASGTDVSGYDPVSHPTIIDFNGASAYGSGYWQFTNGTARTLTLMGIKFTSTVATGKASKVIGGATSNGVPGNLVLTDVTVTNLTGSPAIIDMVTNMGTGTLAINNSAFSNNGRAVWSGPSIQPAVTGSTFTGNTSGGTYGGAALLIDYNGTSNITNSNFCTNTFTNTGNYVGGGAISNNFNNVNSNSRINITNSNFYNNSSANGGGAIGLYGASLTVDGGNFLNNSSGSASRGGGAIVVMSNNIGYNVGMTVQNALFYQNSAPNNNTVGPFGGGSSPFEEGGGAILINGFGPTSDGVMSGFVGSRILNNKFVQNSVGSGSYGGAITLYNNDGQFGNSNSAWSGYSTSSLTATLTGNLFYGNYLGSSGNTTATGSDIIAVAQAGGQFIINGGNKMQLANQGSYLNYALFGPNPPGAGGIQFLNPSAGNNGYAFSGANSFNNLSDGGVGSPVYSCPASLVVLPVQLTRFTAVTPDNKISVLSWTTATEQNTLRFDVQRSADGITWKAIGSAAAAGNSNSEKNYSYTDLTPAAGLNYYRLAQVDKDNRSTLTDIRTVKIGQQGITRVYPNPAVNNINIELAAELVNKPLSISIYSIQGQLVQQKQLQLSSSIEKLDVSRLPQGSYQVRIINEISKQRTVQQVQVVR